MGSRGEEPGELQGAHHLELEARTSAEQGPMAAACGLSHGCLLSNFEERDQRGALVLSSPLHLTSGAEVSLSAALDVEGGS